MINIYLYIYVYIHLYIYIHRHQTYRRASTKKKHPLRLSEKGPAACVWPQSHASSPSLGYSRMYNPQMDRMSVSQNYGQQPMGVPFLKIKGPEIYILFLTSNHLEWILGASYWITHFSMKFWGHFRLPPYGLNQLVQDFSDTISESNHGRWSSQRGKFIDKVAPHWWGLEEFVTAVSSSLSNLSCMYMIIWLKTKHFLNALQKWTYFYYIYICIQGLLSLCGNWCLNITACFSDLQHPNEEQHCQCHLIILDPSLIHPWAYTLLASSAGEPRKSTLKGQGAFFGDPLDHQGFGYHPFNPQLTAVERSRKTGNTWIPSIIPYWQLIPSLEQTYLNQRWLEKDLRILLFVGVRRMLWDMASLA